LTDAKFIIYQKRLADVQLGLSNTDQAKTAKEFIRNAFIVARNKKRDRQQQALEAKKNEDESEDCKSSSNSGSSNNC